MDNAYSMKSFHCVISKCELNADEGAKINIICLSAYNKSTYTMFSTYICICPHFTPFVSAPICAFTCIFCGNTVSLFYSYPQIELICFMNIYKIHFVLYRRLWSAYIQRLIRSSWGGRSRILLIIFLLLFLLLRNIIWFSVVRGTQLASNRPNELWHLLYNLDITMKIYEEKRTDGKIQQQTEVFLAFC